MVETDPALARTPSGSASEGGVTHDCADADIALLTALNVTNICDLMVEQKKRKLGFFVSSSEKAEEGRYDQFAISAVPFPGCEFFRKYKANGHQGEALCFDWNHSEVNAELNLTVPVRASFRWEDYRRWDIVSLSTRICCC